MTGLPDETPSSIRRLLRRCLEKDRTRRLDSAAVARLEIDDAIAFPAGEAGSPAASSRRVTATVVAALASVAFLAATAAWLLMPPPRARRLADCDHDAAGLALEYEEPRPRLGVVARWPVSGAPRRNR